MTQRAIGGQSISEIMRSFVEDAAERRLAILSVYAKEYLEKTGLPVDQIEMIEQADGSRIIWYFRKKGSNSDGLVHRGTGSDLITLCGTMLGTNGTDQVVLSYVDDQVTCVNCLRLSIKAQRR